MTRTVRPRTRQGDRGGARARPAAQGFIGVIHLSVALIQYAIVLLPSSAMSALLKHAFIRHSIKMHK
jgi:hypothetical protein